MKRIILIAVILVSGFKLYAQKTSDNILKELTTRELFDDVQQLRLADSFSSYTELERLSLYVVYSKKEALSYSLLNILPFGIGSYAQGDTKGGLMANGIMFVGFAIGFVGVWNDHGLTIAGGIVVAGGGYIFSLLRPYIFNTQWNQNLRKVLGIESYLSGQYREDFSLYLDSSHLFSHNTVTMPLFMNSF